MNTKVCSILLCIREYQSNIQWDFTAEPLKYLKTNKHTNKQKLITGNVGKDMITGRPIHLLLTPPPSPGPDSLLPRENASSLKWTPSVCTHRPLLPQPRASHWGPVSRCHFSLLQSQPLGTIAVPERGFSTWPPHHLYPLLQQNSLEECQHSVSPCPLPCTFYPMTQQFYSQILIQEK